MDDPPQVAAAARATPTFDVRILSEAEMASASIDAIPRSDASCFFDAHALRAWMRAFLPGNGWGLPMTVLGVRAKNESPGGFVAFATQAFAGLRVASLAGYYWPFRTLALDPDGSSSVAVTASVAQFLSRRPPSAVLRLGPVSSKDRSVAGLVSALLAQGWTAFRRDSGAVFELDLPARAEQLEAIISPSLFKNIAYLRRRLGKQHGEVRAERHVLCAGSAATLATLQRIESASWVAAGNGDPKFIGDANMRYWMALGEAAARPSVVALWTLYCGEKAIAFSANIETPQVVYIVANSFDEGWKVHSPGSILTLEVMRDAVVRGRQQIDWGQGDSGYKTRWGAKPGATLFDVLLFTPVLLGKALHLAARYGLRDWREIERG